MKQTKRATVATADCTRDGFTLLEMMVAVALALLMMTMFVQIFQMATGALATQRALAENDQRARRLQTTLNQDLRRRSYRAVSTSEGIVPLVAVPAPIALNPDEGQDGYFYYAENNPNDDTDDVLQFTIQAASSDDGAPPFFGKATFVGSLTELNQPEADDGEVEWDPAANNFTFPTDAAAVAQTNSRGSSEYAEVCYWLRDGNLYRRQILIRDPSDFVGTLPTELQDVDPSSYTGGSGVFWRDFDYAAYHRGAAFSMEFLMSNTALDNTATDSLGIPKFRFGFWSSDFTSGNPGGPVETDTSGTFIGRLTHEETSHGNFVYPGQYVDFTTSPIDVTTLVGGPRRAEDIILSNVHSFDIKVYDSELGQFEDLGHSRTDAGNNPIGFYHRTENRNYGADGQPGDANFDDDGDSVDDNIEEVGWPGTDDYGNRFDTWHADSNEIGGQQTPFRPATNGPNGVPGAVGDDDNLNGAEDPGELGWPGSDDVVIPLRAIQIKIRYLDVSSNQMRDLTIVHSFADRDDE